MAMQPYTWTGKTEIDGIEELWHVEAANPADLIARRTEALKAIKVARNGQTPAQEQLYSDAAAPPRQTAPAATPASAPAGRSPQARPKPICPDCNQPAAWVAWTSGDTERKAWVCYPCNAWVNKDQTTGELYTKAAQGSLPQAS